MKGGGQHRRAPVDGEPARGFGTASGEREEAVVGTDEPTPAGIEGDRRPGAADARIDHAEEDRSARERRRQRRQQIGRGRRIAGRQVVHQIDHGNAGRVPREHRLDLPDIGPTRPEIGEQHDHRRAAPSRSSIPI